MKTYRGKGGVCQERNVTGINPKNPNNTTTFSSCVSYVSLNSTPMKLLCENMNATKVEYYSNNPVQRKRSVPCKHETIILIETSDISKKLLTVFDISNLKTHLLRRVLSVNNTII